MRNRHKLLSIPKALFEDNDIIENRGRYILFILGGNGAEIPQEKNDRYGYFNIPQTVITQHRRGYLILAEITFLFGCYYLADIKRGNKFNGHDIYSTITRGCSEERAIHSKSIHQYFLENINKYNAWIKTAYKNGRFSVKY